MEERYLRNLGALTEEDCALLSSKKVFVAGCGGLGGYIAEMLLRLGVGGLTVCDGDVFEVTNLNRQLYSTPALLRTSKAQAVADRAALLSPDTEVHAFDCFLTRENSRELLSGCDIAIDALDSAESRLVLESACEEARIPLIHGAVSAWFSQCAVVLPGDRFLEQLYAGGRDGGKNACPSYVPPFCAALEVALCVKVLCGKAYEHGKLYYADLLHMDFETLF